MLKNKLLELIPLTIISTLVNVFITFTVATCSMIQLTVYTQSHPSLRVLVLPVSILIAVLVYGWVIFNHKIRNYIKGE